MLKSIVPVLVLLLLTLGLPGALQGQETLRYRLEKGDLFTVEQQAEQQITQKMDQSDHRMTNRISAVLQFRVVGKSESSYLLDFEFKDLVFSINSNIQGELLNIRAQELDETDVQSRLFNSLLNTPIRMELSTRGEILGVQGGDSLVSRMLASTGLEDGFTKSLMQKSLEQEYGSQALARSYEQMTYIYPARPVQVGDRWKNTFGGKLEASNTWILDSLLADRAVISGESVIRMKTQDSGTSMVLEGTQQTHIRTDRKSGFISQMTVESTADGTSTMVQTGALEIPTHISTHITYTLIDFKHVQ
jgi:hypothetical protein